MGNVVTVLSSFVRVMGRRAAFGSVVVVLALVTGTLSTPVSFQARVVPRDQHGAAAASNGSRSAGRAAPTSAITAATTAGGGAAPHARSFARPKPSKAQRSNVAAVAATKAPARPEIDDDTLLVHFVDGTTPQQQRQAVEKAGGRSNRAIEQLSVVAVSVDPESRDEVAERLRQDEVVELVEHNPISHAFELPNDDELFSQWHIPNHRLPAAWDVTHGAPSADGVCKEASPPSTYDGCIAIIDSGVDLDHPDLAPRIVAGHDFVNNDNNAQDDFGHGTAVAGIAAADTNNAKGVAGAAWDGWIMPVKVLDHLGGGTAERVADGIVWAADNGADVINLSLGSPVFNQTEADAVAYALAQGVVVVAATGNFGDAVPNYPASHTGVIGVGATDDYGDVAFFSSRGESVDVVADGWFVHSTVLVAGPGEGYDFIEHVGTSMASPIVAGVASLVRAKNPTFRPAQVQAKLQSTAIDRGPRGVDEYYGWGLVDAYAAVGGRTAAAPPPAARGSGESDDTAARARAIGSGTTGAISPEGDVDWFFYDAAQAGTLTVTVTPPSFDDFDFFGASSFDPVITAVSPTLDEIGTFDIGGADEPDAASVPVASPGRYLVRVENLLTSRSTGVQSSPKPYSVSAGFVAGAPSPPVGERLWVTDVDPAPFAQGVAATVMPTVKFARSVEESGWSPDDVELIDAKTNTVVPADLIPTADGVEIDPVPPALVAGSAYIVRVSGVVDTDANVMDEVFTSRFTVAKPASLDTFADFNGDGREDTVVASPYEDHGSTKPDGGVVHVLYGSASGPTGAGSQMWSQESSGIPGVAEKGDRFGAAVATGDLNNDGFDDLVIGVPYEDSSVADSGGIHVLLGSSSKLTSTGNRFWSQDSRGIAGAVEAGDRFGAALAVGRFDNVAGSDVAVGVPGEALTGSTANAGGVHTIRGASGGLTSTGSKFWTQNTPGIDLFAEAGDAFGSALAGGDLDGDGHDELAIGSPSDNIFDGDEGSVMVLRGSVVGMRPVTAFADFFSDAGPEPGEAFGASLSIGDVGGYSGADGYADLIIGLPGQTVSSSARAGRLDIVFWNHSELFLYFQSLDQSTFGLGAKETDARFALTLHGRSFPSRGVLAVGIPLDNLHGVGSDAGRVHVYNGGGTVLETGHLGVGKSRAFNQNSSGVPGAAEAGDGFGGDVLLLDTNGDKKADLIAGAPGEGIGSFGKAGALYAARDVIGTPAWTNVTQDSSGISSPAETGDRFGAPVG